jgi:hypothetical protein
MIPDIAVIIATYAVVRLLNEYVFVGDGGQAIRIILAIVATAVIGLFLASVLSSASSIGDLGI